MKVFFRCLLAFFCIVALLPYSVHAQGEDWREIRTDRFAILYVDADQAAAESYRGFVDSIYDEMAAVFGHRAATPLTLRLYPTWDSYVAVNPLARGLQGIVAHADYQRHEVVVVVSQTARQNDVEIQNNIRHELTHIIASDLSENRLNVLFQEGVAQYVEHSAPELETRISLLQRAIDNDQLLRWSDLDDRTTFYGAAEVAYPESLSIVAFLIEKYSFATFRDFLTTSAKSSGYRSALERSYGMSADALESAWRSWLPSYVAGGYRRNVVTAYDLSSAEKLLQEGRYTEASSELETAIDWLRTTEQREILAQAEALLERSQSGQRALSLANDARTALDTFDYVRTAELVQQARQVYAQIGDTTQNTILDEYAARAERGRQASEQLIYAGQLAGSLQYPQARQNADSAAASFLALGDQQRAGEAQTLRNALDQRQSMFGIALLGLGFFGIVASFWRRFTVREAEAW